MTDSPTNKEEEKRKAQEISDEDREQLRKKAEKLASLDGPIYRNNVFQRIFEALIKLFNQKRQDEREQGEVSPELPATWEQVKSQVQASRTDTSEGAKKLRNDFQAATVSSERLIRELLSNPQGMPEEERLKQLREYIRQQMLESTNHEPDQATLDSVIKTYTGIERQQIKDAIIEQDNQPLKDDPESDPAFILVNAMVDQDPTVQAFEETFRRARERYSEDPEESAEVVARWNEYQAEKQRKLYGTMQSIFPRRVGQYANHWNRITNKNNPESDELVRGIADEAKRNQLKETLTGDRFNEEAWNQLPAETKRRYQSLREAAKIASSRPAQTEQRNGQEPPTPEQQMEMLQAQNPNRELDTLRTDFKKLYEVKNDPTAQKQLVDKYLTPQKIEQYKKDDDGFSVEGAAAAEINKRLQELAATSVDSIPVRRQGESLEEYEQRRNDAILKRDREFYSYMQEVQGKSLQWVTEEINKNIWRVADANADWDNFNFDPIQQVMQAAKYVDLAEEKEIKNSFAADKITKVERDMQLEKVARMKEEVINAALAKISYHNIKRFVISGTLEQVHNAVRSIPQPQHRVLLDLPGVRAAINDTAEFGGAWFRKEEIYTPIAMQPRKAEIGEDTSKTDDKGKVTYVINNSELWKLRKSLKMMKEELSYLKDMNPVFRSLSRREVMDLLKGDDPDYTTFDKLITQAYIKDLANKTQGAEHVRKRDFFDTHVNNALGDLLKDKKYAVLEQKLEDKALRSELIRNLANMMYEADQAYDLAKKAHYVTFQAFRYDGSKWSPEAYKRELKKVNTRRRKLNLEEVSFIPNFATPDNVPLKVKGVVGGAQKEWVVNLADLEVAGVFNEKINQLMNIAQVQHEYARAQWEKRRKEHDLKKKQDPNLGEFAELEPARFDAQAYRPQAILLAEQEMKGSEPLGYWANGHFDSEKYERDYKAVGDVKGGGPTWTINKAWSESRRHFINKFKFDININNDYDSNQQARFFKEVGIAKTDAEIEELQKGGDSTLFARSLTGQTDTLVRRLLNLSTYYRRIQSKNKIDIEDLSAIMEIGSITLMEATGKTSTQGQLYNWLQDIATTISVWIGRNTGVEAARGDFTDGGSIMLVSNNSVRTKPYEGLSKLAEKLAKTMTWGELSEWWKDAMKEVTEYDVFKVQSKTKGEYFNMSIMEADNIFLEAYNDANIGFKDYRQLQSQLMGHWTVMELAKITNKVKGRSVFFTVMQEVLKQASKGTWT